MRQSLSIPRSLAVSFIGVLILFTARGEEVADLGTRRQGTDWPGFLGPAGDGTSPEKGIITTWPKSGPPLVWQRKLGTGYGGPTISRGRLFIFDRHGDMARLICMRSETGEELWRFEYKTDYVDMYGYNNGPRTSPVVDGDRVYLFGPEGLLHAVKLGQRRPLWRIDTARKFNVVPNFFGIGSTPIIEGDLLIAMIGGSPPDSPAIHTGETKGNGAGIVAFNKHTGKIVYSITDELAGYASPVLATIGDRRWCFVFARGGLVGFEPRRGVVDFQFPWRARIIESVNASNPVVVGDRVFISETYGPGSALLRVRPGGHQVIWKDPPGREKAMQTHWNTAIHRQGYLYGSSGRHMNEGELRCIELATGTVKWSQPGMKRCSLLSVDGHLVCLAETGLLMLLRATPEKFDLVAHVDLRDDKNTRLLQYPAWAAPVLSHGLLYVRGKGRLVCLELIPAP